MTRATLLFVLALAAQLPSLAYAQTSTGSIRGYVTDEAGAPVPDADVTARNLATGVQVAASARSNGFYSLLGLVPAEYEVLARAIGHRPQAHRVRVLIGQTLTLDFQLTASPVELEAVVVAAPLVETRTSEVATNVTPEQVEQLPTADRSFLNLVTLAPGAGFTSIISNRTHTGDRIDGTRRVFVAGAQAAEQVNLFIDGATYKNDILLGGIAGQDASRGNPFPRNAVQEFRVLTQNYKAEYQKASSAIITAATKSGTNVWEGSAFMSYQDRGLVALDSFQRRDRNTNPATFREPDYQRYLMGLSLGGPLIRDRLHLFASYEGNVQERTSRVAITTSIPPPPTGLDTVNFAGRNGNFDSPFRSTLLFGKLTYAAGPRSSLELSYNHRHEYDIRDFGDRFASVWRSYETAVRFRNDVNTGILKHRFFSGRWLNEAAVSYQRSRFNPTPNAPAAINRLYGFGCCAEIGTFVSEQDFTQKRLSLRNDATYSGLRRAGDHVLKAGVNLDFLNYDVIKRNDEIPRFVYEPWWQNFTIPERVEFQTGDPNFAADNTQIGLYVQDDWSPTPRLTLNLGIRWDYESHMMNYDYVTPGGVVDSLTKYPSLLYIPVDPDRYFTDGDDRDPFYGAFQPRLGFSYAIDRDAKTIVFGGWGIYYDRNLFDQAIEEKFALQHPKYTIRFRPPGDPTAGRIDWNNAYLAGRSALEPLISSGQLAAPEVKLIPNDLRPPVSRQFSLGVRRLLGEFAIQAAYTGVRSKNVMTFYFADRDFTCAARTFACFQENEIPGFSAILLADDAGKTWYDAFQLQVDRPYRRTGRVGWGAGLAYTFAERETQGFNDLFSFPNPVDYPRQIRNDERHRAVANWIVDVPWAWGAQFSGVLTLGSGLKYDVGDRFGGPTNRLTPGGFQEDYNAYTPWNWPYRTLDLRLRKLFPAGRGTVAATLDFFNALNDQNLGCFITGNRSDTRFGEAECVISDPRRLQLGAEYTF